MGYRTAKAMKILLFSGEITMHNIKFIRRRFPAQANAIISRLAILAAIAVALGIGVLLLM